MITEKVDLTLSSIVLPMPPTSPYMAAFEMDIYARFMRQLRVVPTSRPDIQILSCIQYVADMMDISDTQVTQILVELGLKAPRSAFPSCYLESCDRVATRGHGHKDHPFSVSY